MRSALKVVKMIPLNEVFDVEYGNKLDLNKLKKVSPAEGGVNFVGRSSQNHGVSGTVQPLADSSPYPAGLITVALGGSKLLSSFVQTSPFYTAQNVAVLKPLRNMTFQQKLFVCLAIRKNRFRYSAFGREANRTLRTLPIPAMNDYPDWISDYNLSGVDGRDEPLIATATATPRSIPISEWRIFKYDALFEIRKGQRLTKANMIPGNLPFIGASDRANGLTARIGQSAIHDGNTLTVSYNGSVAEAFYQPDPFWASDDINVLYPKGFTIDPQIGLFLCAVIRKEKYRFNYGRKWHLDRMKQSEILLPQTKGGKPDWDFMRHFMNTLPYSSQI